MPEPLKEPTDLDELFAPYAKTTSSKKLEPQEDTTFSGAVKNLYQEGKIGKPAALIGAGIAGYGVKKAWDKSVQTSLGMLKEAATKESEAVALATKQGFTAKPVTLNQRLVGFMKGATSAGAGLPTSEAEQLALAKQITASRMGRPLGIGGYADAALSPKISITPTYNSPTYAYDDLGYRVPSASVLKTVNPQIVSAKDVAGIVGENASAGVNLPAAVEANLPNANILPKNFYQRGIEGLRGMQFGNAGIPLNSLGNVGTSLFKSGAGFGTMMEGATAAYDTWPTWLGGSGNNVYGRTRDELRQGINPNSTFNYDIMPAIGGGLATAGRIGKGAANALTLGAYGMALEAADINQTVKKGVKEYEADFSKNPEKYDPENLERVRLRMIASGMINPDSPQYNTRENTADKVREYQKKVEELKKKK